MALSTSATESLLRAVDIIATSKIGETSYDQTIICTIVDNGEIEKRGFYTVTDGKVRFKAYTNVTDYKVGDQIRVTIPNGDFNAKKYVDGPHASDDDSTPITYVSPLDSFLSMADLIEPDENIQGALKANELDKQNKNGIPIWQKPLTDSSYADLQNNGIYDAIGLSADFKCLLGKYDMKSGKYGLRLDIKVKVNNTDSYIVKSFYLDSSEMFGNPYNFVAPSTQEKMFNIVSVGTITEMTLYFYQNSEFIYYDTDTNDLQNIEVGDDYNIFVSNVRISFGTNIANVEDNTLKIYTLSNTDFNYINPTDSTNLKKIGLLWYNKNELNQYLGFSDGIADLDENGKIIPYDEINYLIESKKSTRLASQMGKENVPKDPAGLELAALTDEAFAAIEEIKTLINEDLINTLENYKTKFKERLPEAFLIIENDYLDELKNEGKFIDIFNNSLNKKQEYLKAMLAHVAKMQRVQNATDYWDPSEEAERPSNTLETNLLDLIGFLIRGGSNSFTSLKSIHDNSLNKFASLVSSDEYQGFKGSYDSFVKSIGDIISLIENKVTVVEDKAVITDAQRYEDGTIVTAKTPLEEALSWYKSEYYVGIYTPPTEDAYGNRYCIYWYRYAPGYIEPNAEFDFAGPEWERIIPSGDKLIPTPTPIQTSSESGSFTEIPNNLGLSTTLKDGTDYFEKKPENGESLLQVYLEPKMHQEKFKAILFYNHEKYESDSIVFTNMDDITSIYTDKTSALSIQHIEDSSDTYQAMYGANNFLTNRVESKKNRGVQAVYNGILGTSDEVLLDENDPAHIYWYIPIENTMINVDLDYLKERGFVTNYVPTYKFKDGILERIKKWYEWCIKSNKEFKLFHDKPYIVNRQNNNKSIPSQPTFGFKNTFDLSNAFKGFKKVGDFLSLREDFSMREFVDYEKDCGKWLPFKMKIPTFDDNDNLIESEQEEEIIEEVVDSEHIREGYAYFYKLITDIEDTKFFYQIKNYFIKNDANNQIYCLVEKSNETFEASLNLTFGNQGALGADYNFIIDPATRQSAVREGKPLQVDIALFDYDNKQIPIHEYDLTCGVGDAYLEKTTGNASASHVTWIGDSYDFNVKEDENNYVIGGEISFNESEQYDNIGSILALTASFNNDGSNEETNKPSGAGSAYKKKKLSNIATFYSVPYASADFYIEGATSVIYDNNGNNPDYYKKPYRIFYNYQGSNGEESIGQEITDVEWRIVYYSYDGNNFTLTNNTGFCENYLPVLNDKNVLTPCATYVDDGNTTVKYYAFIQCLNTPVGATQKQVIWSQPIIVRKNRYAANMENAYDSSLAINLDTGTIISSLMNAFRRGGTTGQSLQGFLVGDLQTSSGLNQLGLYGFNSGEQSFAFGINGTAIIGKNGGAQIKFIEDDTDDTNSQTSSKKEYKILSSSYAEGAKGLKIDLEDGVIDIYGTKKDGENRQTVSSSGNNNLFPVFSKQYQYTNLNQDQKSTAHIYINAASSKEGSHGYVKPESGGFPKWWFSSSWGGFWPGSGSRNRAATVAEDSSLDTSNALFKIEVPNADNSNTYKSLLLISDDNCLIQSNNYKTGQYTWNTDGGTADNGGEGMRIDLSYGTIDAYKLKISSNNILINSSGDNDPLFVVRDENCNNLMYVEDGGTAFFLQSHDYSADNKKGMKIDVMNGSIDSYNFSLRGENTEKYTGAFILITSGNETTGGKPTLQFNIPKSKTNNDGDEVVEGLDLLKISPDEFVLNSPTYKTPEENNGKGEGLSLNLQEGKIISYNFSLRGESPNDASYIYITSNAENMGDNSVLNGNPLIQLYSAQSETNLLTVAPSEFILQSSQFISKGTGIYLDIYKGDMEVQNNKISLLSINNSDDEEKRSFTLTSPDFNNETGASGINLDILKGRLEIKQQNKTLMTVTNDDFMLTSANFLDDSGNENKGMQIDVLNGSIKVRQSSNLTLFHIFIASDGSSEQSQFFMKSQDWQDGSSGMQIDLMNKKIEAYKAQDQKLIIDAAADKYPLQIGTSLDESGSRLKFRVDWDGIIYLDDSKFTIDNSASEGDGSGGVLSGGTFTWSNIRVQDQAGDQTGGKIVADTSIYSKGWIRAAGGLYGQSIYIRNGDNPNIKIVDASGNISGTSLNINSNKATINNNGELAVQSIIIAGGKASINSDGVLTVSSMGSSGSSGGVTDMGAISASTISATGKIESGANIKGATITSTGQLTAGSVQSNGTITANGLLSGANISTNGTLTVGGVTTFKQGIKFGPIDDTAASGTQNYNFTINPPATLTGDLSVKYQKLEVKTVVAADGTEIQVLVVPSGITTAWVLY